MEVINVEGYTEEEKVEIAKNYLIPKQIENHGLKSENIIFSEPAIRDTINYYTRESGVRNLERQIANVCRKTALNLVTTKKNTYRITPKNLEKYLGKKKYRYDIIEGQEEVGVTTGLAWTIVGGDTLFIETTVVPGSGKLVLTGQLGEVMQESAKAGISYIRSVADKLGIEEDFYKTKDLHIHIPEGATPKDGTVCRGYDVHSYDFHAYRYSCEKGYSDDGRNHTSRQCTACRRYTRKGARSA